MRTATIALAGEDRLLCFNTRVTLAVNDRFGDLEGMFNALQDQDHPQKAMEASLWVLEQMMDAGWRYAQHEGLTVADPLTADEILDLTDPLEIMQLSAKIQETMANGTDRQVEAKPAKKASAGAGRARQKRVPSGGSGTGSTSASAMTGP